MRKAKDVYVEREAKVCLQPALIYFSHWYRMTRVDNRQLNHSFFSGQYETCTYDNDLNLSYTDCEPEEDLICWRVDVKCYQSSGTYSA